MGGRRSEFKCQPFSPVVFCDLETLPPPTHCPFCHILLAKRPGQPRCEGRGDRPCLHGDRNCNVTWQKAHGRGEELRPPDSFLLVHSNPHLRGSPCPGRCCESSVRLPGVAPGGLVSEHHARGWRDVSWSPLFARLQPGVLVTPPPSPKSLR